MRTSSEDGDVWLALGPSRRHRRRFVAGPSSNERTPAVTIDDSVPDLDTPDVARRRWPSVAEPTEEQITDQEVEAAARVLAELLPPGWAEATARRTLLAAQAAKPKPEPQLAVDGGSCVWVFDGDYWREYGDESEPFTAEELTDRNGPITWFVPAGQRLETENPA